MKLIVGLGNPGKKYVGTRHNVGFEAVAALANRFAVGGVKTKFEGELVELLISGTKCLGLCPHTYMNDSGRSVRKAIQFYKLELDQMIVITDDLDLPVGRLRLKRNGSAGGQRGIADIIRHLQSESFARLKIGIGRPPAGGPARNWVLGGFDEHDRGEIDRLMPSCVDAISLFVREDISAAMNAFNHLGKAPKKQPKPKPGSESSDDSESAPDASAP